MMMPNDDIELLALTRRYVMPGRPYLKFQGWNLRHLADADLLEFGGSFRKTSQEIEDEGLTRLLAADWRAKITASWMIAMSSRDWFGGLLKHLLWGGQEGRAALGHVFALTSFGRTQDLQCLRDYARRGVELNEWGVSHDWAIAGWKYHQARRIAGSQEAALFKTPGDAWLDSLPSPPEIDLIEFLCGFVERCGLRFVRDGSVVEPLEFFLALSGRARRGAEAWGIVPDEDARQELDRRFLSYPGVADELRAAAPLAVAADSDFRTVLYGLNPAVGEGRWVVSNSRRGIKYEALSDLDSAVELMGEWSHL
ncbi:DUF6000 family protein [Streptomyces sp. 8N114]|uniref:DUF6000 family protein n=1 Tax=Streptomyces sp. 8N114 TaxID=3457419 RepID=UPI003FD5F4DA